MFPDITKRPNVLIANTATSVSDVNKSPELLHHVDISWLPFAAELYKISKRIEDYVLVTTPICPSDIPNRNGIIFPLDELIKFQPPPIARMSYKAWTGCPVHYEHRNEIHEDAYGVIFDSSLHKVNGYGGGKLWKVMGLLGIDKTKYPQMAERVLDGDINTYSMGALVNGMSCSYCGTPMSKKSHCTHLNPSQDIDWRLVPHYSGIRHLAARRAHGIEPIETSLVESPAWTTALSDHILTR